jgi:hypothetical protein
LSDWMRRLRGERYEAWTLPSARQRTAAIVMSGTQFSGIGNWLVRPGICDPVLARIWSRSGCIWQDGRCRLGHEELTDLIRAAGGIGCEHALTARALLTGGVELVDGIHRWAVADELGIDVVPVEMEI